MKAVVLCAGLGTRLGNLTAKVPKAMLPIGGEPLLAHTLRYLAANGFREIAINLHFMPELIREQFGDGSAYGLSLRYSFEQTLLGTAGALRPLGDWLRSEEHFLVLYGDILTDQPLRPLVDARRAADAAGTIVLHRRVGSNSIVEMDARGRITNFVERPAADEPRSLAAWVNSGIQLLTPRLLAYVPADRPSDLPRDVYVRVLGREPLFGFPLTGFRCAIDSPERYREAQEAFGTGRYARLHQR